MGPNVGVRKQANGFDMVKMGSTFGVNTEVNNRKQGSRSARLLKLSKWGV